MDTVLQVMSDEPVPPRRLNPTVDRDLETICLKCLEKDQGKRYASAAAMGDDLRRYLEGEPIVARPVTALERGVKWARRRPAIAGLTAALAVALAAGFAGMAVLWARAENSASVARKAAQTEAEAQAEAQQNATVATEKAEALRRQDYTNRVNLAYRECLDNNVAYAVELLDGCPEDLRGWEWAYVNRQCHLDLKTFREPAPVVNAVAFSTGRQADRLRHRIVHRRCGGRPRRPRRGDRRGGLRPSRAPGRCPRRRVQPRRPADRLLRRGQERQALVGRLGSRARHPPRPSALRPVRRLQSQRLPDRLGERGSDHQGLVRGADHATHVPGSYRLGQLGGLQPGRHARRLRRGLLLDPRAAGSPGSGYRRISPEFPGGALRDRLGRLQPRRQGVRNGRDGWHGPDQGCSQRASDEDLLRNTLGVARYRAGQYQQAAADLERSRTLNAERFGGSVPADLAFLAMARHRLGRRDEARETLGQLREAMSRRPWSDDEESRAIGDEAILLIAGKKPPIVEAARYDDTSPATEFAAFTPDGKRVLSCADGDILRLWDRETGRLNRRFDRAGGRVLTLAIAPDGRHALTAGQDRALHLIDLETGKLVRDFKGHAEWVLNVAFSPDGKRAYSTSGGTDPWTDGSDSAVRVWDVATGKEVRKLEGHKGRVYSVAVSPDGKRLLSGGDTRPILWDADTGKELRRLQGHEALITDVAFFPDGRRAASTSYDGTIRLWDLDGGQELHRFVGRSRNVIWVAVSPDGRRMLTSDYDAMSCGSGTSRAAR